MGAVCYILWATSAVFQPLIVKRFVDFLQDDTAPRSDGYTLAALLCESMSSGAPVSSLILSLVVDLLAYTFSINFK